MFSFKDYVKIKDKKGGAKKDKRWKTQKIKKFSSFPHFMASADFFFAPDSNRKSTKCCKRMKQNYSEITFCFGIVIMPSKLNSSSRLGWL